MHFFLSKELFFLAAALLQVTLNVVHWFNDKKNATVRLLMYMSNILGRSKQPLVARICLILMAADTLKHTSPRNWL